MSPLFWDEPADDDKSLYDPVYVLNRDSKTRQDVRDFVEDLWSRYERIGHEGEFLAEVGNVLAATLDSQETVDNIARLVIRELADLCVIEFVDEHGELTQLELAVSDPAKAEIAAALKELPLDRAGRT